MSKPFFSTNPFDVLLRLHQEGEQIDPNFSIWLRSFRHPPIRTVAALIEHCPRIDWLFWFLEQSAKHDLVARGLVINAGMLVRHHLDLIASGKTYTATRGSEMPHTEGLAVLRDFLRRVQNNGG